MRLPKSLFVLMLLFTVSMVSQKKDSIFLNLEDYTLVKVGDTLTINLEEFYVLPKLQFSSPSDSRYYYWFRSKVFKAYHYAKIASQRLDSLNLELEKIETKRAKKKYVRRLQKYLEGEFTDQLKKMTHTEGRILIKLIHRQTGRTTFDNIKVVRSGWNAFWYNTTANLFNLSLKSEYRPHTVNEDYLIEDILQRAFIDESIVFQKSKLIIDFPEIARLKKGKVDVEKYKMMFAKKRK